MATLYHGSTRKYKKLKVPRKNSGGIVWATTDKKTADGYATGSYKRKFRGSSKYAYVHTMPTSASWETQGHKIYGSKGPEIPTGGYWLNRETSHTSHPNFYNKHDRTIKSSAVVGIVATGAAVAGGAYYYRRRKNKLERVRKHDHRKRKEAGGMHAKHTAGFHKARASYSNR